jgi:hypothetical protein
MSKLLRVSMVVAVMALVTGCAATGQLSQAVGRGLNSYQGPLSSLTGLAGDIHISAGKMLAGDDDPGKKDGKKE